MRELRGERSFGGDNATSAKLDRGREAETKRGESEAAELVARGLARVVKAEVKTHKGGERVEKTGRNERKVREEEVLVPHIVYGNEYDEDDDEEYNEDDQGGDDGDLVLTGREFEL